jgi:modulator of drug activity B
MQVLLINGHEVWPKSQGRLNQTLFEFAQSFFESRNHTLALSQVRLPYKLEEEVNKFLQADLIIYFTPVYWMDIPASFKHYLDRVYSGGRGKIYLHDGRQDGGQYGTAGLLQAKYSLVTTWNAPSEALNNPNAYLFGDKSVDDVFFHFHSAQKFIGLTKAPTFTLHDVTKNPTIDLYLQQFENHLLQILDY